MTTIETEQHIAEAARALQAADPRLVPIAAVAGKLPLRRRADGFEGLVAIILSQQLSRASADAIHGRLVATVDPLTPAGIAAASDEMLREAGLSRPKIRALRSVAASIEGGTLDTDGLRRAGDDEVRESLCRVKGVGPWTADIYLLACLGRADIFPARDLALQEAARIGLGLAARPSAEELLREAEQWRPWRTVAAVLLWAYYRHIRREITGSDREQGGTA